jgi:hypothetical protein
MRYDRGDCGVETRAGGGKGRMAGGMADEGLKELVRKKMMSQTGEKSKREKIRSNYRGQ